MDWAAAGEASHRVRFWREGVGIVDDDGGVVGGEQFDGFGEVGGGGGPKQEGLASAATSIMSEPPSLTREASDEDGEGEGVEFAEFAHGG